MPEIKVMHVNRENFRPYGQVISMQYDNTEPLSKDTVIYNGVLALMDCNDLLQIGLFESNKKEMTINRLEQHCNTQEFLFAARGDFIVPAAYSDHNGHPDSCSMAGFMVKQGEGIVFDKGIWHTSPIPAKDDCLVVVVFKKGTPENDVTYQECETYNLK